MSAVPVRGYDQAKEWFENRRYKSKTQRTLYGGYRRVTCINDHSEFMTNNHSPWMSLTEIDLYPIGIDMVVPPGVSFWKMWTFLGRTGKFSYVERDRLFDYLQSSTGSLRDALQNEDILNTFYPVGSYGVGWFRSIPNIVYHPNGNITISTYGSSATQSFRSMFYDHIGDTSKHVYNANDPTNGILVGLYRNQNYLITKHSGLTKTKVTKCYTCKNKGKVPTNCGPWTDPDTDFEDKNGVLRCKHNYSTLHLDWTQIKKCPQCGGDKSQAGRSIFNGFKWSGAPIILNPNKEVIKTMVDTDCTLEGGVPNVYFSNWSLNHISYVESKEEVNSNVL